MPETYTPQQDFSTTMGRVVPDGHLTSGEWSPTEKAQHKETVENGFPGAIVVREATKTYNCHAFAHAGRHAWFNDPVPFMEDDYLQSTPAHLQVGDAVVYMTGGVHTHSGVITQVTAGGQAQQVRSKWGKWPEVLHAPTNVPADYGSIVYYLRRKSLKAMPEDEALALEMKAVEQIDDLIFMVTGEGRLQSLDLASSHAAAERAVTGFPEVSLLAQYGRAAAQRILERLESFTPRQRIPLIFVLARLRHQEALPVVVALVARIDPDAFSPVEDGLLVSAFYALQTPPLLERIKEAVTAAKRLTGK